MDSVIHHRTLLRLPQVLEIVPVSRSAWWAGVREGKYPQPVKLGPRTTCWRASDVFEMIEDLPRSGDDRGTKHLAGKEEA